MWAFLKSADLVEDDEDLEEAKAQELRERDVKVTEDDPPKKVTITVSKETVRMALEMYLRGTNQWPPMEGGELTNMVASDDTHKKRQMMVSRFNTSLPLHELDMHFEVPRS